MKKLTRDDLLWLQGGAVADPEQPETLFCKTCYSDGRLTELRRLPEKARHVLGTHRCPWCHLAMTIEDAMKIPGLAAQFATRKRGR